MDIDVVNRGLQKLDEARYEASVDFRGYCRDGYARATISQPPQISLNGWHDAFDGRVGTDISLEAKIVGKLNTTNCDFEREANCYSSVCPDCLTRPLLAMGGRCYVNLVWGVREFPFRSDIKLPEVFQNGILVRLNEPEEDAPLRAEFVRREADKFVGAGAERIVPVHVTVTSGGPHAEQLSEPLMQPIETTGLGEKVPKEFAGLDDSLTEASDGSVALDRAIGSALRGDTELGSSDLVAPIDGAIPKRRDRFLIVDATIGGKPDLEVIESLEKSAMMSDIPIWDEGAIGLSVASKALFGNGAEGAGAIGTLLPIRLSGRRNYRFLGAKGELEFEIVLDGGAARICDDKKFGKVVEVELKGALVRIWRVKAGQRNGSPAAITNWTATAVVGLPRFDSASSRVIAPLHRIGIRFVSWFGLQPIYVRMDEGINAFESKELVLADLNEGFRVSLPDCIKIGLPRARAKAKCSESSEAGYMGLLNPEKLPVFVPHLDRVVSRPSIDGTRLQISVPVEVR